VTVIPAVGGAGGAVTCGVGRILFEIFNTKETWRKQDGDMGVDMSAKCYVR
jgi:hypothetical protein